MSAEIRVSEPTFNNCKAGTARFFDPVANTAHGQSHTES